MLRPSVQSQRSEDNRLTASEVIHTQASSSQAGFDKRGKTLNLAMAV